MKKLLYGVLTKNEYQTLKLRMKHNKTFEEIAKELRLSSRSNAYTIFNNAIKKLKASKEIIKEFGV